MNSVRLQWEIMIHGSIVKIPRSLSTPLVEREGGDHFVRLHHSYHSCQAQQGQLSPRHHIWATERPHGLWRDITASITNTPEVIEAQFFFSGLMYFSLSVKEKLLSKTHWNTLFSSAVCNIMHYMLTAILSLIKYISESREVWRDCERPPIPNYWFTRLIADSALHCLSSALRCNTTQNQDQRDLKSPATQRLPVLISSPFTI